LSLVFAILAGSFRLDTGRLIPRGRRPKQGLLLAVLLLAGCGGSPAVKTQRVSGAGFHFMTPAGWTVQRTAARVSASHDGELVEVARFPLLKPYRAALFARVAGELEVRMRQVARQVGGTVEPAGSATAAGVRSHVYRIRVDGHVDEYTFVLVGQREYQLLCRTSDGGGVCSQLQSTFTLQ
jgi:hypothetical protein